MYKFSDVPSPSKNMAYPIIHHMYTGIKMLNKIDNPSKQTVVVIYVWSVQNGGEVFLMNQDFWHIYSRGLQKQEKDIPTLLVNGLPCKGLEMSPS